MSVVDCVATKLASTFLFVIHLAGVSTGPGVAGIKSTSLLAVGAAKMSAH